MTDFRIENNIGQFKTKAFHLPIKGFAFHNSMKKLCCLMRSEICLVLFIDQCREITGN